MPSNSYYSDFEYHVPESRKKLKCPKLSIIFLPQKTKGQKWYEINSSNSGRPSIVWYTSDLLSRFWQDIQKIIFFFRFFKFFSYWKYVKTVKSMIMNIKFSEFWYKKHKIWVVAADRDMVEILSFELCFLEIDMRGEKSLVHGFVRRSHLLFFQLSEDCYIWSQNKIAPGWGTVHRPWVNIVVQSSTVHCTIV